MNFNFWLEPPAVQCKLEKRWDHAINSGQPSNKFSVIRSAMYVNWSIVHSENNIKKLDSFNLLQFYWLLTTECTSEKMVN